MDKPHFNLESQEEIARFEALADAYAKSRAQLAVSHLSLTRAYEYCQTREDGGKLFSALLDVRINFLLLWCDFHSAASAGFRRSDNEPASILESEVLFMSRMDMHRFNTSFVFRYRALWDKLMGVLVLMFSPENYEKFVSAKSRRKAFRKCLTGFPDPNREQQFDEIDKLLEQFDNEFRTPEVHGTGYLRKWSFTTVPMMETPSSKLLGYWNVVNALMAKIGEGFGKPQGATT